MSEDVPPLRFLFDYVSPYAYLASTQIRALAKKHGRAVEAVPVLFGPMLDASGARGPGELPMRREYMFRDILRLAKALGVPLAPPAVHPFNPLLALRATTVVTNREERWALVDRLFRAAWAEQKRIDDPAVVGPLAERAAEAKAELRAATDSAIARGVFGVPTILVDNEIFWGLDSLDLLDRYLGGERAYAESDLGGWRAIVPSAQRRGA